VGKIRDGFMTPTRETFDHHNEAYANFDVDELLKDYDEESMVVSDAGVFTGEGEIREMFEGFFEEWDDPRTEFELIAEVVEGDVGVTHWQAETPETVYEFGTDTFIIRDGVIKRQTFAALAEPK
jgi:ketosteroid isomerase-like protein